MEDLIGTEIAGCRIESKIGQGGMGAVYKAHHLALDIPVAVKILTSLSAVDKARERFMREARIAAKLRHSNIVGVLNVGTERGIDFIVMEYVDGRNLREVLAERTALPREEAVAIALEVLDALRAAQENGIVHRDIKPENIMIDASGTVRVTDLGLARSVSDVNLTQSSMILGSPLYVAPEQADNPAAADIRADIYSLGCTLFHMLTGSPPFTGTTPVEVILNHTRKPVPHLLEVNPAFSRELDNVVFTMMQKGPQERYQTPREASAALKSALANGETAPAAGSAAAVGRAKKPAKPLSWAVAILFSAVAVGAIVAVFAPQKNPSRPSVVAPADGVGEISDTITTDTAGPPAPATEKKTIKPSAPKPLKNGEVKPEPLIETKKTRVRDPLLSAVKTGDTEELLQLLNDGGSANGAPGAPTTPLHEAVRRGQADQVKLLLQHGGNPNLRDAKGDVPLHYALREDAQLMVRELLQHGADPNLRDHGGKTPLEIAASVSSGVESLVRQHGGR
jgi:predicted Ser/Thr protein kinase